MLQVVIASSLYRRAQLKATPNQVLSSIVDCQCNGHSKCINKNICKKCEHHTDGEKRPCIYCNVAQLHINMFTTCTY